MIVIFMMLFPSITLATSNADALVFIVSKKCQVKVTYVYIPSEYENQESYHRSIAAKYALGIYSKHGSKKMIEEYINDVAELLNQFEYINSKFSVLTIENNPSCLENEKPS